MVDSAKTCCIEGLGTRMVVLVLHIMTLTVLQLSAAASQEEQQTTRQYKYLDNQIYKVPVWSRTDDSDKLPAGDNFDENFPPPPLYPPPPPNMDGDSNAIIREAVYNVMAKYKQEYENDPMKKPPPDLSALGCSAAMKTTTPLPQVSTSDGPPFGPDGVIERDGPPGPKGARGKRGRKGKPGPKGPKGPVGPVGPKGEMGLPGVPGDPGESGMDGKTGKRGSRGFRGFSGLPGRQGDRGSDGIPGLVIFHDATAMYGVALEGLIAYRSDVKQLYFRDHVTWRAIRITRCGDGIHDWDQGEECDDGNSFTSDDCVHCKKAKCGDGFLHAGVEECDGRSFGGQSCSINRPGMVGRLLCTHRCKISYKRCRFPRT